MMIRFLGIMAGLGLIWGLGLAFLYCSPCIGWSGQAGMDRMDRARVLALGGILELGLADSNGSAGALFATDPNGFWSESDRLDLIVTDLDPGGFVVGTTGVDRELQTIDDIFYYFPQLDQSEPE